MSKSLPTLPIEKVERVIILMRGEKVILDSELILQNATSKKGRGGRRKLPYAFTEHGAIMAANVLSSHRAVKASVQVVRAFIQLRRMLASSADFARKLERLEKKYDQQFKIVFDAIRQLLTPPPGKSKVVGFTASTRKK